MSQVSIEGTPATRGRRGRTKGIIGRSRGRTRRGIEEEGDDEESE